MTVLEIVRKYLEQESYDGLCAPYGECGCKRDDLAPCGEIGSECSPGFLKDGDDEADFYIVCTREAVSNQ